MIEYYDGTVFNTPAKTIVNTVNCAGVMGAGIALEFKLRYPEMYEDYVQKCKEKKMKVGIPRIYEYSDELWILNFPTKGHWRFPSKIQWIEQGLKYFAENYKKRDIESIAFPKLGTNNGGLDWTEVKEVMEKYLNDLDIKVYICLDEKKEAEGIEKLMIEKLNSILQEELIKKLKVPKKQVEIIFNNMPYSRLWHLSKLEGITSKTYEKIFLYLYKETNEYTSNKNNSKIDESNNETEQLSLFYEDRDN